MILYQGLLRSSASWARVGRGYLKALLGLGASVGAVASRGFRYDPEFAIPVGLREYTPSEARGLADVDVGLGFLHPPYLDRLVGERRVNLFVWESDRVPESWVEQLDRGVDLVLVPSQFVRAGLVRSGFPGKRVGIVPYGYDAEFLAETEPPDCKERPFTFLAVLAPHYRKGIEELLSAYREAFDRADAVQLWIKTTYDPGDSRRRFPFEIPSWAETLTKYGLRDPDAALVTVESCTLSDEAVGSIFSRADVVVQPSWGEAFGLVILEALAASRPVVTTDWGGQTDFLPDGADRMAYRLEPAGDRLYERVNGALVARPDVTALAARMRWHFEHPEDSAEVGRGGRDLVAGWTWERAARRLIEVLT